MYHMLTKKIKILIALKSYMLYRTYYILASALSSVIRSTRQLEKHISLSR